MLVTAPFPKVIKQLGVCIFKEGMKVVGLLLP